MATLLVCALCKGSAAQSVVGEIPQGSGSSGQSLIDQLTLEIEAQGLENDITLQPVRCMAACHRACNAALMAPGKLTFILNDLSPQTAAPDLLAFCQQYNACDDGRVPYRSRGDTIKQATAYVLPPLAIAPLSASAIPTPV